MTKARDDKADIWKRVAQAHFTDHLELIDQSEKLAAFVAGLSAALPADLSPGAAAQYSARLDLFVFEILVEDWSFSRRRGVAKEMEQLRDRLAAAASPPPSPTRKKAGDAAGDAFAQAFLNDAEGSQEALAWLKDSGATHTLGEMASTAVSVRLVNAFYRAGAVKVWAVAIDRYPNGMENTGKLVIELPGEEALRAQVLQMASRKTEARGFGEIGDEGQRYVFLMLD
jgi:hypothetical protein